ncbi:MULTISPECIES: iron ABC transporter permease [Thermococcus]|uniref:Maltooligosaccharide ABC transporter, permease component n=2 Tax=Thermococcus sibiricus TaxID=172049 RepID=C6A1D8_THESM|nr:Maltooligosaccharide ABC transporter, permease component [Thermococcus sibiricus MM 739]KUK18370.1 MAG: Maltooligosaccharide ABC transporter, permease component [Thermococcus sibiricus]KUK28704.1 MAG: Maltooligosaccharide ABC transporter, permease component [Thermococcus sp. 40_45]
MGMRLKNLNALLPLVFLFLFFYFPLISILKEGLWDNGITLRYILRAISNSYHRRVIFFTFWQALASTLLTLFLGFPGAYIFAKYEFPGKGILKALLTVPFVMPSIMVALGFILLFGRVGIITQILGRDLGILYSWKAIILAHAFYNFPVVVRMVSSLWQRINPHYEEAAISLGARGFTLFRKVTLPMLMPAIFASSMLTFVFCFLSFSVPLILGGYQYATIEVDIFTSIMTLLDFKTGAALAIIQIFLSLIFMYLYLKSLDLYAKAEKQKVFREPVHLTFKKLISARGLLIIFYSLVVFLFILSPLLAVIYHSFTYGGSFTLEWYRRVFSPEYNPIFGANSITAIRNSLLFGFSAVILSTFLALSIAYIMYRWRFKGKNFFDAIVMLPLASSAITLGLGYIRAFHKPPLEFLGTWYLIIFAHTIIAYPFVLRSVSTSLKKINPNLKEAAMSLGVNELGAFLKVELPLAFGGIIVGAIFAFAMSIAELGATYMIYRPEYTTITIAIYRFLGSRQLGPASAMSVLLILVSTIAFIVIEKTGEEIW